MSQGRRTERQCDSITRKVTRKAPQDYTLEEWQQVLHTNLTGVFLCARAVYPHRQRT